MPSGSALPTVTDVAVAATLVGWLATEGRRARHRRPDAAPVPGGRRGLLSGAVALATLVALSARAVVPAADLPAAAIVAWAGLALAWAGLALRWWSFATLGDYFTFELTATPDQPVIAHGPYRLVRHPSYLGVIAVVVGLALARANGAGVAAAAAIAVTGAVLRIRVEERLLLTVLGARYARYARGRARLVPGIW
ncbi:MAG: methyltransferase family protein [Acidimicrobiales bacterium]